MSKRKSQSGKKIIWGGFAIALLLIVSLTVLKPTITNIVINGVFFVVIAIMFFKSGRNFDNLATFNNDIENAIKEFDKQNFSSIDEMINVYQTNDLFENNELNKQFKLYLESLKQSTNYESASIQADIEDFINYNLIDDVLHHHMVALIPGTLTGLGILGTFVGLSFGLQEFNITNSVAIEKSIGPLMEGIKVAFYTSIAGIFLSLIFNYVLRKELNESDSILNNFVKEFKEKIYRTNENDVINILIQNQTTQIECLNKMHEDFTNKIGDVLSDVLTPELTKMNSTIELFAANATKDQREGVDKIVNNFVDSMNESLGDNFKALGDSIAKTVTLQENIINETKSLISEFKLATTDMTNDFEESSNNIVKEFNNATVDITNKLGDVSDDISDINSLSMQTVEGVSSYITKLNDMEDIVIENINEMKNQLQENQIVLNKQSDYVEVLVNYEKNISDASSKFTRDMSEQLRSINELKSSLAEESIQSISKIVSAADDNSKLVLESVRSQLEEIVNTANSKTNDMNAASRDLSKVVNEINGRMADALETTFMTFDEELSQITQHLSGTISNIQSETERVPGVVNSSYQGIERGFKELQSELDQLVNVIKVINGNMKIIDNNDGEQ